MRPPRGRTRPSLLRRYADWLHLRWPAGTVEPFPEVDSLGRCAVPGLYIAGDLRGVPLLKFAADSGARAVQTMLAEPGFRLPIGRRAPTAGTADDPYDLIIVGAGVAGMAAALEADAAGLAYVVLESNRPFSTIANFPPGKPIFTYPLDVRPAGQLELGATVKERLAQELGAQTQEIRDAVVSARALSVHPVGGALRVDSASDVGEHLVQFARRVLLAVGRSGDFRRLGVPGETLDKVQNRLYDPKDSHGRRVAVVGGGDSAAEAALALADAGATVVLIHRGEALSRPKPALQHAVARAAAVGQIELRLGSRVREIRPQSLLLERAAEPGAEAEVQIENDQVFLFLGRQPPLDLLRRSGVRVAAEWTRRRLLLLVLFLVLAAALESWKSGGLFAAWAARARLFPLGLAHASANPKTLLGTLRLSASAPGFWYTAAYGAVVLLFGLRRMRRARTPYVTAQTLALIAIQIVPLFLLPEIILPQLGYHRLLPDGLLDALFPRVPYGHGREYWRAYGFILAWPLDVYNWQTARPLWAWIGIGAAQTFVLLPWLVRRYGKGGYCGWICSCGALAETLGDSHRRKMVHGPKWNRLNLAGQAILAVATVLFLLRVTSWIAPGWTGLRILLELAQGSYRGVVDGLLATVLGLGLYAALSGRVWCRFFCPLAALMHIYARFSRFRIFSEKPKCISCNLCTAVCHQGIDVASFAARGEPMADPQCVRCSACVAVCPTGALRLGRLERDGSARTDRLDASLVQIRQHPINPGSRKKPNSFPER